MSEEPAESALAALAAMRAARREQLAAETRRFTLLCDYADACSEGGRLVPMGHEGTPWVVEYAELELGAALQMDSEQAAFQLGLALDVRHRLPHAWAALQQLRIRVWQAEKLASATTDLDLEAARAVDAQLSPGYGTWSARRLLDAAEGLVLQALPPEEARARQHAAREQRHVRFGPTHDTVQSLDAVVDGVDGAQLESQVARLAGILREGGSAESRDVRRARALGLLANPARALQLLQRSLLERPAVLDDCPLQGQPGHACGTVDVDPEQLRPRVELVVHVSEDSLRTGRGVARSPRLGAMATGAIREALEGCNVHVRPVLKVDALAPADCYEVPVAMREAIALRNPVSTFPHSTKRRGLDLDHTVPYVSGASAQTRPGNLGPLSRREHRAKTHAGWRVTQPIPGVFLWRSPQGFVYAVTQSGTWELHDPTRAHDASPPRVRTADATSRRRPVTTEADRALAA